MKITKLRVNQVDAPLGFAIDTLSLSWVVEDAEGKALRWTRVEIRDADGTVYDSGECKEADSRDFPVPIALMPRHRYFWRVTVTLNSGESGAAESRFETGKRTEPWCARWISPCTLQNSCILQKKFRLDGIGKNARFYICTLGVYECYLNGKKVGDEYLAPGYHSYDFHLQAQSYDVDGLLTDGENELSILLGEGWFKGRLGFDGGYTNLYGDRLYAIGELHIPGHGGDAERIIVTDESWVVKSAPITFANIYDGEHYDARIDCQAVDTVELREPAQCGPLTDRYSLPVRKMEALPVKEFLRTPVDELVLDFGQEITGWVEVNSRRLSALLPSVTADGNSLTLTAGEILQGGCFYRENYRTAKSEFCYTFGSKAPMEIIRPHFTFFGFRYMKLDLTGLSLPQWYEDSGRWAALASAIRECFTAFHLRSDFAQTGYLKTGVPEVNQLISNAVWSQKDNFLDVPTDCPQRDERLGWTGDAQVFSQTACLNMYVPAFYRKYLWDMRAEQSALDGAVPNIVPRIKRGMVAEFASCPWADAGVLIPWNVYRYYGSKTLLRETYPGMKAWVDYQYRRELQSGGAHLIQDGFHFGDWLALDNDQPGPFGATDPFYIASAYYYRCCDIVAQASACLGYTAESDAYAVLAKKIRAAIQGKYFRADGSCTIPTQTASALAIMFGLTDNPQREGELLARKVEEKNNHLDTGFVGTALLCSALSQTGHHDIAVSILLNSDYPSWLYSVKLGATTIWERWNSVLPNGELNPEGMNSLNHYSYGSILAWIYSEVCGLTPDAPGFQTALIAPKPDPRLKSADCRLDTASGTFRVRWHYSGDGERIKYQFSIPCGAQAKLQLPGEETCILDSGYYEFERQTGPE